MKWSFRILCGLAVLSGLGSCARKEVNQDKNKNVLVYPLENPLSCLDPGLVLDAITVEALQNIFEAPCRYNTKNELEPQAVEQAVFTKDMTCVRLKLRKGMRFHDSSEVCAEDFVATWERNSDPKFGSGTVQTYYEDIVGFAEKNAGKAKALSGIRVIGPTEIEIKLVRPTPYFLGKLCHLSFAPMPKKIADKREMIRDIKAMVGTGPFKASHHYPDQEFEMVANSQYWKSAPSIAGIRRPVIPDPAMRLNKYKTGHLDMMVVERSELDGIRKDSKFKNHIHKFPRTSLRYLGLNQSALPALRDVRVRRAIAMSVDHTRIVKEVFNDHFERAHMILPQNIMGNPPGEQGMSMDPVGARALLSAAGYGPGKQELKFDISVPNNRPDVVTLAEVLALQLKAALGIEVKVRKLEFRQFLQEWGKDQLPVFCSRWAASYLDPSVFLSMMLTSHSTMNHVGFSDPQFDRLCEVADSMVNAKIRTKLYQEAESLAIKECVWIPITFESEYWLIRPNIQGVEDCVIGQMSRGRVTKK